VIKEVVGEKKKGARGRRKEGREKLRDVLLRQCKCR
jgi:hypothetical protein